MFGLFLLACGLGLNAAKRLGDDDDGGLLHPDSSFLAGPSHRGHGAAIAIPFNRRRNIRRRRPTTRRATIRSSASQPTIMASSRRARLLLGGTAGKCP